MSLEHGYIRKVHDGMRWLVHEDFMPGFPDRIPCTINDPIPGSDRVLLQKKSGRACFLIKQGRRDQGDIFVKLYEPRAWIEYIKYLFKNTRAKAEYRTNLLFRKHGLPTPVPLAWGEKRVFGIWTKSALVLECIDPGTTLSDYLKENRSKASTSKTTETLAVHVAQLHNSGFYYRDLHGQNILLGNTRENGGRLYFVDLHEVRHVGKIEYRMCIDDLGRLNGYVNTPVRNRIAFLKKYLAERNVSSDEWKVWARDIDKRTREIWDRHFRKRGVSIKQY